MFLVSASSVKLTGAPFSGWGPLPSVLPSSKRGGYSIMSFVFRPSPIMVPPIFLPLPCMPIPVQFIIRDASFPTCDDSVIRGQTEQDSRCPFYVDPRPIVTRRPIPISPVWAVPKSRVEEDVEIHVGVKVNICPRYYHHLRRRRKCNQRW